MHNKDLHKVNGKCIDSIKNNVGCAFCRGFKRCEDYSQNVTEAMNHMNLKWEKERNQGDDDIKTVKHMKHKPTPKQVENAQIAN